MAFKKINIDECPGLSEEQKIYVNEVGFLERDDLKPISSE